MSAQADPRRLRVAIVMPHPSEGASSGDRLRTVQLASRLEGEDVDATIMAYRWGNVSTTQHNEVFVMGRPTSYLGRCWWRAGLARRRGANPFAIFAGSGTRQAMARAIVEGDFDVVDFQHSFTWFPTARPNIVTFHNVETDTVPKRSPTGRRVIEGLRALEAAAVAGTDRTVVFSDTDAERVLRLAPFGAAKLDIVPLGYEPTLRWSGQEPRPQLQRVGYVGSFDYAPNRQAAENLLAMWPALQRDCGVKELWIIGRQAARYVVPVPGVRIFSDVPAVAPLVADLDALLVPLLAGGGVRVKIIEAFALGVPVLSTAIGIEGLGATHGRHAMIVDSPDDLAGALEEMRPQDVRSDLCRNAFSLWQDRFTPEAMARSMAEVYRNVAAAGAGTTGLRSGSQVGT